MPRLCTICSHRRHTAIDAALVEHTTSYRRIADQFGVAESSLVRHEANCLGATLQRSREARQMLDAERLAERMAQLSEHVDLVLAKAGRDHRVRLLAVDTGRKLIETWAKLAILHAAEQRTVVANDEPHVWDDDPNTIRTVLKMLVESGAMVPLAEDEQQEPEQQERQQSDDGDGPAPQSVPV